MQLEHLVEESHRTGARLVTGSDVTGTCGSRGGHMFMHLELTTLCLLQVSHCSQYKLLVVQIFAMDRVTRVHLTIKP